MPGRGPTDPAEAHFDKGLWAWDGSQWRKLPMLFGYSAVLSLAVSETSAPAGTYNLDSGVVPAGEIWIVNVLVGTAVSGSCTSFRFGYVHDGSQVFVEEVVTPVSAQLYNFVGQIVLDAGDYLRARFYGLTLNDDVYLYVTGYKMAVAE